MFPTIRNQLHSADLSPSSLLIISPSAFFSRTDRVLDSSSAQPETIFSPIFAPQKYLRLRTWHCRPRYLFWVPSSKFPQHASLESGPRRLYRVFRVLSRRQDNIQRSARVPLLQWFLCTRGTISPASGSSGARLPNFGSGITVLLRGRKGSCKMSSRYVLRFRGANCVISR